MGTFKDIGEAKEYFSEDLFASENGIILDEIGEGSAKASVVLTDRHKNAQGGIMGGVIFTLADLAFAAACNNSHMPSVAQQVSINYLAAPKGGRLTAQAECVKNGRTSGVYKVKVTDDQGHDVALFIGVAFKL